MDKVKKFLESYVEWLAVTLGLGFLGWMIYGYVIDKPVSSSVGSNTAASPSEIDPMIWEGPGQALQAQIAAKTAPPLMGPTVDFAKETASARDKIPGSVLPVFPGSYVPLSPSPDATDAVVSVAHSSLPGHVTQLPEAPELISLEISAGHSNVPAPVPPAAAGAPAPTVPASAQAVDLNWRTIGATLPVAEIAKSFAACKIPDMFSSTAILRVTMIRQERDGSGKWGAETEIAPLDTNPLQDLPRNTASAGEQKDYYEWAEKNVEPIAAPKFYTVLQGDVWYQPGTKSPNQVDVAVVDDGFDPKNPGAFKGNPGMLTPDEKIQYDKYLAAKAKRQAAKQKSNSNRNGAPPFPPGFNPEGGGGPPGFGGGGRVSPVVPDIDRMRNGGAPQTPNFFPGGGDFPPGFPPGMQPPGAPPDSANTTLPQGSFNPATQANIKVWAHDVTVQPGKTYRYKLRYIISNPVARTMGLCVPTSLADQFYIVSKDSAWTDPVSVESDTNFYAVDTKHGVRFDIFKWKNGTYQMQTVQVNPGDMIGNIDAATTNDFTTHWTLVDVREDPRDETNKTIVLVSDNGTVLRKELVTDQHSAAYRRLLEQANAAKVKTAAVAPGVPPG